MKLKLRKIKKTTSAKRTKLTFLIVSIIILIFIVYQIAVVASSLGNIQRTSVSQVVVNDGVKKHRSIKNIVLLGLDARPDEALSRSDTIMILSLDKDKDTLTLLSILRDTFVAIPDKKVPTKINSAFFFGKALLTIDTINYNFDMDIRDYIAVDFKAIVDIVDALGGIEMTVDKKLVSDMNYVIGTTNRILGGVKSPYIEAGTQLLDGRQALSYARMRRTGNADFDRTKRQRELLVAVYHKVRDKLSLPLINKLLNAVTDDISTSLSSIEMISLVLDAYGSSNNEPNTLALTDHLIDKSIGGQAVLFPNRLKDMAKELHEKLYGEEENYTPSKEVENLSDFLYDYR